MIVAIWPRSRLLELTRMENWTDFPEASIRPPSCIPMKASLLEQPAGALHRLHGFRQRRIQPNAIGRRDMSPQCACASAIHQTHDGLPIHSRGNRLPESRIAKPGLLAAISGKRSRIHLAEIEK